MNKLRYFLTFLVLGLFFLLPTVYAQLLDADTISISAVVPGCGNNIIEGAEQCDGISLGGQSCSTRGFTGGTLSCSATCTFNTSQCSSGTTGGTTGGGTTGGGSAGGLTGGGTTGAVLFSGRAYPSSEVTILKDAQVAASTIAGADANFSVNLTGLSGGNYIFSIYSEDNAGNRSSLLTFPVSVTAGATAYVSGIFIAPTIDIDKSTVKKGEDIAIFGQSLPSASVTIAVSSEEEHFNQVNSDINGVYLYNFDTAVLEMGEHYAKSKAASSGSITQYGKSISFTVGNQTIFKDSGPVSSKGDVNDDAKVNLVDFSILAYWYKRAAPPAKVDLNADNKVDLIDFSILAFYWTG